MFNLTSIQRAKNPHNEMPFHILQFSKILKSLILSARMWDNGNSLTMLVVTADGQYLGKFKICRLCDPAIPLLRCVSSRDSPL